MCAHACVCESVFACVCAHVCVSVCVYVCVCARAYVCESMCGRTRTRARVCVCETCLKVSILLTRLLEGVGFKLIHCQLIQ